MVAISEGIKSELGKHHTGCARRTPRTSTPLLSHHARCQPPPPPLHAPTATATPPPPIHSSFLQSIRTFKGGTSGIAKLDQECCLTILGKDRSLDLQAPNRLVRRDWLLALRLGLTSRALSLEKLDDRRRLREFVKPRPRKRAKSRGAGFANFFASSMRGSRANSTSARADATPRVGSVADSLGISASAKM